MFKDGVMFILFMLSIILFLAYAYMQESTFNFVDNMPDDLISYQHRIWLRTQYNAYAMNDGMTGFDYCLKVNKGDKHYKAGCHALYEKK